MRVLFWSETFWPRVGGVENLAARLLPALRDHGHEFAVVTWEDINSPDQIRHSGIPIYRFPFFSTRDENLTAIMTCRSRIVDLKKYFAPDVVHVNSYGRSVLFHLNTMNSYPAPVLLTLHQPLPEEPIQRDSLLGHLLRASDWVNTCSQAVLTQVRRLAPEAIQRSSFIYNALEPSEIYPQPLSFDPPRILCVGRLVEDKGFDLALTAFETIIKSFPRARLVLAGDGSQREKLHKQTIELGLVRSVEFLGSVPPETVAHLIDEATIVMVPSRLEGFGLVALEAAIMSRPVVATRVGGLPEVVLHQKTGLLVNQEDTDAMVEATLFLLNNPQESIALGEAARLRAQEVFSFERYVAAYGDLYRSLGSDRARTSLTRRCAE